ncbi:hypothetical protein I8752_20515 [Nostocaceae cyanobacterium CENA369]|uniref:Uncharacterized protein n=1 Tax=Dendronalium phyllosphericum CENA369 TaxID=1725256 RepID=A0A8J7IAI2_9NOST|nr:hypothetical protein [Dendronalium phyllosphericum]MBH8575352.1 hypothetical protein [Dendronalium phyllosphericum CENA369]
MNKPSSRRKKATSAASSEPKPALEPEKENPASVTIEVTALVVPEELSESEQHDRLHLERKVEHAFYEAGKALTELRDRRLYRSTHRTFEEYCRDRFGFTRMAAALKIASVKVIDNLSTNGLQNAPSTEDGLQILPTNERQVRPMTNLEPQQQREVWQQAVNKAGGKIPSGRIVQDIVDKIRERTKVPNPYREGEICILLPKDNPDLRGKGGCWGVIAHVGDYSCTVGTWDGDYTVKIEHLKLVELLEEDCKFMQQLCMRLRQLHQVASRDPSVDWLLQGLGKQAKPYLSSLQAKLLAAMEREYKLSWKQQK